MFGIVFIFRIVFNLRQSSFFGLFLFLGPSYFCGCFLFVKLQPSLTVQSKSVGLGVDTKMSVQTPPHPQKLNGEHQETQINIY